MRPSPTRTLTQAPMQRAPMAMGVQSRQRPKSSSPTPQARFSPRGIADCHPSERASKNRTSCPPHWGDDRVSPCSHPASARSTCSCRPRGCSLRGQPSGVSSAGSSRRRAHPVWCRRGADEWKPARGAVPPGDAGRRDGVQGQGREPGLLQRRRVPQAQVQGQVPLERPRRELRPGRVISDCHPSEGDLKTNRTYGLSVSGFYF